MATVFIFKALSQFSFDKEFNKFIFCSMSKLNFNLKNSPDVNLSKFQGKKFSFDKI